MDTSLIKRIKNQNVLLFILTTLCVFVRFHWLDKESLYGDEAYSIYHGQQTLEEVRPVFLYDQNPPLHILLLHFWMKLFGVSDLSAKAMSAFFSVLAGLVLYLFAKKHLGRIAAFFVFGLYLFSNAQQFYASEARMYSLIQFLSIGSFYFYFEIMSNPRKRMIAGLFVANIALLFTHYLTIYIFIVQFAGMFFFLKTNRKAVVHYLISQVLVVLAFLPWLKIMLENIPQSGSFWNKVPNYAEFRWHVNVLMGSEKLFYVFFLLTLCSFGLVVLNKRFRFFEDTFKSRYYYIFLLLMVLPVTLNFYVAQITPVFLNRYVLYSTLGMFLLIGYCIGSLKLTDIVKTVVFAPLLLILFLSFEIKQPREDNWKLLVEKIKAEEVPGSFIFVSASYKVKEFSFYYDRSAFCDYKNTDALLKAKNIFYYKPAEFSEWEKIPYEKLKRIIYVQSHSQFEDPENKIKQLIESHRFKATKQEELKNGAFTVFVKEE